MRVLLRETEVPGAALAIIHDGRVVFHRAYGVQDAATGRPVDADSVFESASISKTTGRKLDFSAGGV